MEQKGLRKRALEEIERIEKDGIAQHGQSGWVPAWGKNRIQAMVENRPDWCISRQRTWGVPISCSFTRRPRSCTRSPCA